MLKESKEEISMQIMAIGAKIHALMTIENQDDVYEVVDDLSKLQDKVFGL